MKISTAFIFLSVSAASISASYAQEVCFFDAKKDFESWKGENSKTLGDLSEKYKAAKDPYKEMIQYNGMTMPVAAALIIEGNKYGESADKKIKQSVDQAQSCSGQTQTVRGVYDFARDILGIKTILPEQATRIDFEELRRGNIAGGEHSFINEAGRKIDETLNPFRW